MEKDAQILQRPSAVNGGVEYALLGQDLHDERLAGVCGRISSSNPTSGFIFAPALRCFSVEVALSQPLNTCKNRAPPYGAACVTAALA
jgi:hypothetical protein